MSANKRPAPPTQQPVDPPSMKKPRRNPALSCQLCRIKKIKCSRVFPCSNCVTRNVECIPQDAMPVPSPSTQSNTPSPFFRYPGMATQPDMTPRPPPTGTPGSEQKPLPPPRRTFESSFRVEPQDDAPSGICMLSMVASREAQAQMQERDAIKTANFLEELAMARQGRRFNTEPPQAEQQMGRGSDGVGAAPPQQPNTPPDMPPMDRNTMSLTPSSLPKARHPYHDNALSRITIYRSPSKASTVEYVLRYLPPEMRARQLLANFFSLVHPFTMIVHEPTVMLYIDEVYRNPHGMDTETLAAVLSLLFAMMAVGGHYWPLSKTGDSELNGITAEQMSCRMQAAATEALELANYISCPTLETIQACTLLPLALRSSEDWTALRNLRGFTVKMCQTLGLHKLPDQLQQGESRIVYDLKRRLWWYIASSDWLGATQGGPHQGIYTIQYQHCRTSYPAHCDDVDLSSYTCYPKSEHEPTDMSFFLARCTLADITREAVDTLGFLLESEMDYDSVLTQDARYRQFFKTLPHHLRSPSKPSPIPLRPYITWQRLLLHIMYHTLIMRLHAPFLIRGSQEPRFAYSRMTILRSLHQLISLYHTLHSDPSYPAILHTWTGIQHLFLAVLLLAIDLFCNEDEPHASETRKSILDSFSLLERERMRSPMADEGIGTLFAVVRRWKDAHTSRTPSADDTATSVAGAAGGRDGGSVAGQGGKSGEDGTPRSVSPPLPPQQQQQQQQQQRADGGWIGGLGELAFWGELLDFSGLDSAEFLDWAGLLREMAIAEGDAVWC